MDRKVLSKLLNMALNISFGLVIKNILNITDFAYGWLVSNPQAGKVTTGIVIIFFVFIIFYGQIKWQDSVSAKTESP